MKTNSPRLPIGLQIILSVTMALIMYGVIWVSSQFKYPPGVGWTMILMLLITYLTFELVVIVQNRLMQKKLVAHLNGQRALAVLGSVLAGTAAYTAQFYVFKWMDHWVDGSEPPYLQHMVMAALIGLVFSVIFAFIQLGISWKEQYFESQLENERFKGEIAKANLSILKNQLDPHFMFNNFNTLYYLIDEDSDLARKFLKNVSTIYRYILQNNDKALIPAHEEYEMARQYLAVIQQRYEGCFTLIDETSDSAFKHRDVPPLVLQQLIENAIKHNRIDEGSPLRLSLSTHDDYLTVKNNLNPKRSEPTGKTGLKNIEKRYHYLTGQKVKIRKEAGEFSVSVPLIAAHV